MFQLNKFINYILFFITIILLVINFNNLMAFAESKIIINDNINEKIIGPAINEYKIMTNLFSGTKSLVDDQNKIILSTTSSKDQMGFLYDNETGEKKYIWKMTPNGDYEIMPDCFENDLVRNFKIYNKYTYYDFNGNKILINDDKMHKIEYLIGDYMIYNTWNEKEPEMKAYNLSENKIISLGDYNYLDIIDDKIVLSKDVYNYFYENSYYQRNEEIYYDYCTSGNNKMIICNRNFDIIKIIDKYSYIGRVKFNEKIYYKVYMAEERSQNDNMNNIKINFLDENFNLVLDMPVFDNSEMDRTDNSYEHYLKPDIVFEFVDNINSENEVIDENTRLYRDYIKRNNKKYKKENIEKNIYLLKDEVKLYKYDFLENKINSILDGKILTDQEMKIYNSSKEIIKYTFKNGVIRILKNDDGKYRIYDKYYNLIFDFAIEKPIKFYDADLLENVIVSFLVNGKKTTLTFDKDYNIKLLNDDLSENNIMGAGNAYFYYKESVDIKDKKVDKCKNNILYNINDNSVIKLKNDKLYKNIQVILIGKNYYIKTEYTDTFYGDLFDIDGNLIFENFWDYNINLQCKEIGKEIYIIRLINEKLICDSDLKVLCRFSEDFEHLTVYEQNGKVIYLVRLYNYDRTKIKNWTVYYAILNSKFELITKDFDKKSTHITQVSKIGDYIMTLENGTNKIYYDYDGNKIKKIDEKAIQKNDKKEEDNNSYIMKEIAGKTYYLKKTSVNSKSNNKLNLEMPLKVNYDLYDNNLNYISTGYCIYAFTDGTFIIQEKDKLVYFDQNLNRNIIFEGCGFITNLNYYIYSFNLSHNNNIRDIPLNDKKNYWTFESYDKMYVLFDNNFNIILENIKCLSECDSRYVNYVKGFKYGLYDTITKKFVNSYSIFDNFDEDEEDCEWYPNY